MSVASWISPKTEKGKPSHISGRGFFAKEAIKKGELLAVKNGHLIDRATLEANWDIVNHSHIQITDDIYMAPLTKDEFEESMIFFNHCCEPNMAINGQIACVALRDIHAGEELSVDYATIFNNDDNFECSCGNPTCRHHITGRDWQKPELQQKYGNNFAWFILGKMR
ncbi:MAG TPA: SET domain-containing protein-lysine N-methyltransferase [Candidatus Saccharimonadales bacterium]|nr:SET domain-containing protein-lysine N-methyltransferase [Candidatus Saccharimonadales bacterium]